MSTNSPGRPPTPSAYPPRRRSARRFAVGVTLTYSIVVLVLAFAFGARLHDWARTRILQSSILATLAASAQVAPAAAAPAAAAQQEAQPATEQTAVAAAAVATPSAPPINILLLGTDERPDEPGPSRTDTMILLTVSPSDQSIGMLSLPRDLWVPIPGQGVTTKINTAYILGEMNNYPGGGSQLAKDTVSSFVGQPVDYFVRVNFDGFREIIDLIGGIDVNVPTTIHDEEYPTANYGVETFHLDAGVQHLDGETALKFARTRHGDDDYSRSRRQQDIIRAIADRVLNAGMIPQLLPKAPQLLMTTQNTIQTDISVSTGLELAKLVNGATLKEIRQLVLDNQYGEETYSSEGAWILVPDRAKVRVALAQFFHPSNARVAINDAGAVRVEILNGTSQPGVAASVAELLQSQGWQVAAIGDADRSDYAQTIVINYDASDALVQKLSADLGLEPNLATLKGLNSAALIDLRVVVGSDLLPRLR